jgi:2-O-(6-phospho-alpha-D-mannosyl)-D-glycerate hydrolase
MVPEGSLDVHVVSHTHWDREWYLTREQFRLRLVDLIDHVLDRMDSDPRFSFFHLDGQTIVLEDYLEARPERRKRLARRIAEGRLLVGPWYVMPDMFLVSGEALVRNLALGHRIAERFGTAMPVGYMPDPFGHVAQMPQILSGFGLDSAVLWRGFGGERAEYWWEGPDGSQVLLLHLPREGYCNGLRLPLLPPEQMSKAGAEVIRREHTRSAFGTVLLMVGVDHVEPHPGLTELVARIAGESEMRVRLSTLPAYAEAVRSAARRRPRALETVQGELRGGESYAPLLPGVLSARSYLKQANARVQTALERWAEPLTSFAWLAGADDHAGILAYAWRTLLQNHPHDSICGCSIDEVHDENMSRFSRAAEAAEGVASRAEGTLLRAVPPPPPGALRFLVLNTEARSFSGVVDGVVEVPLATADPLRTGDSGLMDLPFVFYPQGETITSVSDAHGRPVPFQLLGVEQRVAYRASRFEPPWPIRVRRFHMALALDDVPSCGFAALDAVPGASTGFLPKEPPGVTAGERWMENAFLRVEANADGTLDVHDKRSGVRLRRCGELEDSGDVGDEYNHAPPARDRRVASAEARVLAVRLVDPGPLRATLAIDLELPVPAAAADDRCARSDESVALPVSLRICLDAGSPRLCFSATVDNSARDHRLRVVFATGATGVVAARAETAFGLVKRPARRPAAADPVVEAPVSAAPLQSFVDAGDEERGAVVFGQGLMEYEALPGEEGRLALTLLRAVGDLSRDDLATRAGHAGPAVATPGAQCPGLHEFRFAYEPRSVPPSAGELFASARAYAAPPRLAAPAGGSGRLPPELSFVRIECEPRDSVVLSACKRADDRDSLLLRLFNPGAAEGRVILQLPWRGISRAFRTDLRERRQDELRVVDGGAVLALPSYRIQTVELVAARHHG